MNAFCILLRCVAEQFVRLQMVSALEISDFGADVTNRAHLNYSVFTRQVQLGRSTTSGGITCALVG